MSFSASLPPTNCLKFDGALDTLQPSPPLHTSEGLNLFNVAREAARDLYIAVDIHKDRPDADAYFAVSISGHCEAEMPGSYAYDSVTVSVTECPKPVETAAA